MDEEAVLKEIVEKVKTAVSEMEAFEAREDVSDKLKTRSSYLRNQLKTALFGF